MWHSSVPHTPALILARSQLYPAQVFTVQSSGSGWPLPVSPVALELHPPTATHSSCSTGLPSRVSLPRAPWLRLTTLALSGLLSVCSCLSLLSPLGDPRAAGSGPVQVHSFPCPSFPKCTVCQAYQRPGTTNQAQPLSRSQSCKGVQCRHRTAC